MDQTMVLTERTIFTDYDGPSLTNCPSYDPWLETISSPTYDLFRLAMIFTIHVKSSFPELFITFHNKTNEWNSMITNTE